MTVSYNGLWKKMIDKNLQKQDLVNKVGLSSATVAKMGKGEPVSNKVLEKLAVYFECNVSELINFD
jgi:DNA-binding Xre family transcriptional regulator